MNQSIPSMTKRPLGIRHVPTAREVGFRPTFLARGLGFRIREIFYIARKDKCRKGTSRFVSKKLEAE